MLSPETDLSTVLARRGITRRQLVKFCSAMLGTLALPDRYLAQVVQAVGKAKKPVLLWLQFQDCTGCSESMIRSSNPSVGEVVLDLLSWEYHEVIMAGAGKHADAVLDRVVNEDKGKYIAVVEGAIPTGDGFCTIGGRNALEIAEKVCRNAAATIAVGACAFDGGLVRSDPNPTGALGVHEALPGLKVMNRRAVRTTRQTPRRHWFISSLSTNCRPSINITGHSSPTDVSFTINASAARIMTPDASWWIGATKATAKVGAFTRWAARVRRRRSTAPWSDGTITPVGRSAPVMAASPAHRRDSGTPCPRSTIACLLFLDSEWK
jgi:NADH ubiquinone oxidoreductase, 20 Kd subunit